MQSRWMSIVLAFAVGCASSSSSPTGPGESTSPTAAAEVLQRGFGLAPDIAATADEAVTIAVRAVFTASTLTGAPTFTGTLTETAPGSAQFSYAPAPDDRLVIESSAMPRIEVEIDAFDGDTTVGWEGFRDRHAALRFTMRADTVGEIVVDSRDTGGNLARTIEGRLIDDGQTFTVNVAHARTWRSEFSGGVYSWDSEDAMTGRVASSAGAIELDESTTYALYDDRRLDVQNLHRRSGSSVTVGGRTLAFRDLYVRSEHVNNQVNDPEYWIAQGTIELDGQAVGTVRFYAPVLVGTAGPEAIIDFGNGDTVLIGGVLDD